MVDPDLQDRLRSLIQRRPALTTTVKVSLTACMSAAAGMFVLLIYINDTYKIPTSIALSRLEEMLVTCTGEDIADVRARIEAAPPSPFWSFSMTDELQAITAAIDDLKARECIALPGERATP